MKYKAICFDIDGTLYPVKRLNSMMTKKFFFHPVLMKKYDRMRISFRKYQNDFKAIGLEKASLRERELAIFQKEFGVSTEKAEKIITGKFYSKLEKLYSGLPKCQERADTLKALKKQGYKIGVFSDWPLYSKLKQLGCAKYIDFAASSDDVGYLKPDSHCFEYLLYNLKVKPSEVLYVGDSYEKDILGACKAGLDAVLVEAKKGVKYKEPIKVFENWNDFDSWILNLAEEN